MDPTPPKPNAVDAGAFPVGMLTPDASDSSPVADDDVTGPDAGATPPLTEPEPAPGPRLCDAGPCTTPCEPGFAVYPELDPFSCLRVCSGAMLETQEDVDRLAEQQCGVLDYLLWIGDSTLPSAAITDLSGLATIRRVDGNLLIHNNTDLSSLEGLNGLLEVGGRLEIRSNGLTSLDGLEELREVGDIVDIEYNPALADTAGLANLERAGALDVLQNDSLAHVSFPNLVEAADVYLWSNAVAQSVDLPKLEYSGDRIVILEHASLSSVDLHSLQWLDGTLYLGSNTQLPDLAVPELLTAGSVRIEGNIGLETLDFRRLARLDYGLTIDDTAAQGFDFPALQTTASCEIANNSNLQWLGTFAALDNLGELTVSNNPMLPFCAYEVLYSHARSCDCTGNGAGSCDANPR